MARKEPICIICADCGAEVWTVNPHPSPRCPECRAAYTSMRNRIRGREYREARNNDPEYRARDAARVRKWQEENQEKCRAARVQHYQKNRDRILERRRAYRAEHAQEINEYQNKYRAEHKEKTAQYRAKYRTEQREKYEASRKRYYAVHEQKIREYQAKYYQKNREKLIQGQRLRRLARKGVASAIMELKGRRGELLECPRMRMKATSLPCGKREECFGAVRCGSCPAGAEPPSGLLDKPWIPGPVLAAEW